MTAITVVFPGQGSQSSGMLAELGESFEVVRHTFEEASDRLGKDLWKISQEGPDELLNQTETTQPLMLTGGVAVWRVWREQGGAEPLLCAGHSLGEYTALVAAGALEFGDAVNLVAQRGQFMQAAVPAGTGAMAAVLGMEDAAVAELCQRAAQGEVVEPVNYNTPGQVVIAGHRTAVERAIALAEEENMRAVLLPVSVPSHCSLMRPAADQLAEVLKSTEIKTPAITVLHNVDVSAVSDPDEIRDRLVRQLYRPVRWVETIRKAADTESRFVVELGPGKVLSGLNRRIERTFKALPVNDSKGLAKALETTNA